jgi:beta-N-acetylhexosaminidase
LKILDVIIYKLYPPQNEVGVNKKNKNHEKRRNMNLLTVSKSGFRLWWKLYVSFFLLGRLSASDVIAPVNKSSERIPLSLEEKIGQLFIVPACTGDVLEQHLYDLEKAIRDWHIGGVLLKQGTLRETDDLIRKINDLSDIPLLICADAEWGLSMRISDAIKYPRNMTLGAIQNMYWIEQMGSEIGKQMQSLGIHLNLAPVVDVNSNPKNPIIYTRSFGDDPWQVAKRGRAFIKGLQREGVLACAKHFPGHGDTIADSHVVLPGIDKSFASLEQMEFIPFKALIEEGVSCVMTAHLSIPSVDEQPVTLSKFWVTDILRNKWGFQGLVITDALNMDGIAKGRDPGEVAVQAFLAGHDLLLYGDHIAPRIGEIFGVLIPKAIEALKKGVEEGVISIEELDRRVERILEVKKKCKKNHAIGSTGSTLPKTLYSKAITMIGKWPSLKKIHLVEAGPKRLLTSFLKKEGILLEEDADDCVLVVGEIERGTEENRKAALEILKNSKNCQANQQMVILFGSPYNLAHIPEGMPVLVAYEDTKEAWEAVSLILAGKMVCEGKLPIEYEYKPNH